MLGEGGTYGVFQCESGGIRALMINMHPHNLEDIIAVIALYRPGPMDFIPAYLENRKHPDKIEYATPELKPILDVTYGTIVYQEQVMQIFRDLAGYSMGASDMVRRAVAKKQADVLEQQRKYFLFGSDGSDGSSPCDGCIKRGISEKAANKIFDDMGTFASYAFNKSHSAAYAYVTFQTAWLRCHYPAEFMAAMMTSVLDNTEKMVPYISECGNLGVEVLPPHVNFSDENFTVTDGKIRFGLLAIKQVSGAFIHEIVKERKENGDYKSFYTFCERVYEKGFNRRSVEQFIKCGALDGLGLNRRQMLLMMDVVVSSLEVDKKKKITGQIGLFDLGSEFAEHLEPAAPDVEEMPEKEKLAAEKETTGIYISGHPMAAYKKMAKAYKCARVDRLLEADPADPSSYRDGAKVSVLVIIATMRKKITKNDTTMAFLQVEDMNGAIEVLVFPKAYDKFGAMLEEDAIILMQARLSVRDDEAPKLLLESVTPAPSLVQFERGVNVPPPAYETVAPVRGNAPNTAPDAAPPEAPAQPAANQTAPARAKPRRLFLRFPSASDRVKASAESRVREFPGATPVCFYFEDTKQYDLKTGVAAEISAPLLENLRRMLGEKNVVLQ